MEQSTRKARCLALLLALVLLVGCGSDELAPALDDEYRDTLSISPEPAQPGDRLTVKLRDNAGAAGLHYALQEWDGEAWQDAYCMRSDAHYPPGEELPPVGRPRLGGLGCLETGEDQSSISERPPKTSPMVEHLRLPDALDAGTYRLCEASNQPSGCALLEVSTPS